MKNLVLLDKPFVSDFLKQTITKNQFSVVDTHIDPKLVSSDSLPLVSQDAAIASKKDDDSVLIYSNSENAISWIEQNLEFSSLPDKIRLFKNKVRFRELIRPIYPDYFFKGVAFHALDQLDPETLVYPFVIKPAIGFFSMGVYKVDSIDEWPDTLKKIKEEVNNSKTVYPKQVIDTTDFIIEQAIEGDEFAIDCYFNNDGKPVILNIMQHIFSSGKDVSDRLYFTSKKVIETQMEKMQDFVEKIGALADVKNFPTHIEVRVDEKGTVVPIEVNPMRFGGWCSSPDMAWYAFGINEYEYFFNRKTPDWKQILANKDDKVHAIVILDNSTGIDGKHIRSFNYKKLLSDFEKPLDFRKADFKEYPLFGLLFCETSNQNSPEINRILKSDLKEYVESQVAGN
jgi:hypothetical protein